MRLFNRITLPSAVIGLLLLVLGVSGAWYVLQLQRSNSQILDVNVMSIRAAEELEILVRETRHELDRFLLSHDRDRVVRALEKEQNVEAWLAHARDLSVSDREKELVAEIQRGLDEFFTRLRQVLDSSGEPVSTETVDGLVDGVLTNKVLASAKRYLDLNEQELQTSNEQNKAMAERLALALLLLGTCGAIAGLVAGYGVARGISRSLLQLSVPIRDVAGKLNEAVGPVEVSADPSMTDLEMVLQTVSSKVGAVVQQLQARHREVIRADQLAAVGQLAAGLAHELRNPLMCMATLVQSARRRGDDASLDARDLSILDEEISRLEKLLQGFLDFAKPGELETRVVDLADVIRHTVEFLSKRAEGRKITIDCQLPEEPLIVDADATQLRQVLLNMLLNALDAVQNGGKIWVDAACVDARPVEVDGNGGPPYIRLRVADNGHGLPAIDRRRIYEPFFSTKETGLGLGLAVSQRIIDLHGGKVLALDRENGGAIFEVHLPAQSS